MKKPHEMSFAEFAESVQPSGGVNRWPQFGTGKEMVSYSVYMNGPLSQQLPEAAREHEYRDVTLQALTEKLGLSPESYRDNMKVAELVATRHAYMTTLLEASFQERLKPEVSAEFDLLTEQLDHPYIQKQLSAQRALAATLAPVLQEAASTLGSAIDERAAGGVSSGVIVSQNNSFTVQSVGNGQVVAHENSRLAEVPAVGQDVTVAYYRGKGQMFENGAELLFSQPFVDEHSGDMAVRVTNVDRGIEKVVLFNSMAAIVQFAKEHELREVFVQDAMDARIAQPKRAAERPSREAAGEPYIDRSSGCVALDYREGDGTYTVLFGSAETLAKNAHEYGAGNEHAARAYELEREQRLGSTQLLGEVSLKDAFVAGKRLFEQVSEANAERSRYAGVVVADTQFHVVQDIGRNAAVIHDKRNLDKLPAVGQRLSISYDNGLGSVLTRPASQDRDVGR